MDSKNSQNTVQNQKVLKPDLKSALFSRSIISAIIGSVVAAITANYFSLTISIIAGAVIAVLLSSLSYFNMKSREYSFGDSSVEWHEGFIDIKQSSVAYNRVTDVTMSQPVLQRLFGTGTVKINTAGSDTHEIRISYIENPEEEYENIKQITNN